MTGALTPRFQRFAFLLALAALALVPAAAETRDGVFIHVSHGPEAPHRPLMVLHMANMMAVDHPVLADFDIQAVHAVLRDAKDVQFAHFPSLKTRLAELVKRGFTLLACPNCLQAAGKSPADLAPGIQPAEKAQFFRFTSGRIITLDY
ncbi:MAG: hypothetical protein KatS3mg005_1808 [Bryobacteraceae bacterium]|nr:MAG: hypothetical protein KatS3mg005_1808 [Bryobacteraceae bacterium]